MPTQVTVGDSVCTGVGPNKKLAKRVAAEQMLLMLGYSLTPPPPARPALKTSTDGLNGATTSSAVSAAAAGNDKHVTFAERDAHTGAQSIVIRVLADRRKSWNLCIKILIHQKSDKIIK